MVVERDLGDAEVKQISTDRRFEAAYGAALQLATIVIRCAGFRTAGEAHHWTTFQVLPQIMGPEEQIRSNYFNSARAKRNMISYQRAGVIGEGEVAELLSEARRFKKDVHRWLERNHPEFVAQNQRG